MTFREHQHFPDPNRLLDTVKLFSQRDSYGDAILSLDHALVPYEKRGSIQGFRSWLLASELTRQRLLWDSTLYLTGAPRSDIRVKRAISWLSDWPKKPAQIISWKTLLDNISGKNVSLVNGSFRKIPTPAQITFVRKGILTNDRAEANILVLEPIRNILDYKPNATVFPRALRSTMWSHIPLLEYVVQNRRFMHHDPFQSWKHIHREIQHRAKSYEPIIEMRHDEQTYYREKAASASTTRQTYVFEDDLNIPAWLGYGTSIWESASKGEEKFTDMATRFLVTRKG